MIGGRVPDAHLIEQGRGGGTEAVDEGCKMRAFGFLTLTRLLLDDELLAPLPIELRKAAAIELWSR